MNKNSNWISAYEALPLMLTLPCEIARVELQQFIVGQEAANADVVDVFAGFKASIEGLGSEFAELGGGHLGCGGVHLGLLYGCVSQDAVENLKRPVIAEAGKIFVATGKLFPFSSQSGDAERLSNRTGRTFDNLHHESANIVSSVSCLAAKLRQPLAGPVSAADLDSVVCELDQIDAIACFLGYAVKGLQEWAGTYPSGCHGLGFHGRWWRTFKADQLGPDFMPVIWAQVPTAEFAFKSGFYLHALGRIDLAVAAHALVQNRLIDARFQGQSLAFVGGNLFSHVAYGSDSLNRLQAFR